MPKRTDLFIAYCYPEKRWLDRLQAALKSFGGFEPPSIWDEQKVQSGPRWKKELPETLSRTRVAVMIVSDAFFETDLVRKARLPALLEAERDDGLKLCWVLASHVSSPFVNLRDEEAAGDPNVALDGLMPVKREAEFVRIAARISRLMSGIPLEPAAVPAEPEPADEPEPARSETEVVPEVAAQPGTTATAVEPPPSVEDTPDSKPNGKKKRARKKRNQDQEELLPMDELNSEPAPKVEGNPATHLEPGEPMEPVKSIELATPVKPAAPDEPVAPLKPTAPVKRAAPSEPVLTMEPPPPVLSGPEGLRLMALDAIILQRRETLSDLRYLCRWLRFSVYAVAASSLVLGLVAGWTHFLLVAGFAAVLASLYSLLRTRMEYLGQRLVGIRYARSGLADELLPARQREPLLRRAEEVLS